MLRQLQENLRFTKVIISYLLATFSNYHQLAIHQYTMKMHLIPTYFAVLFKMLLYFSRVNYNKVMIIYNARLGELYLTVKKQRLNETYYKKIGMCEKNNLFKMILMLAMKYGMMPLFFHVNMSCFEYNMTKLKDIGTPIKYIKSRHNCVQSEKGTLVRQIICKLYCIYLWVQK